VSRLFKGYPSKKVRPTFRSIVVGAAYDFGLLGVAAVVWFIYLVYQPNDGFFYYQRLQFCLMIGMIGLLYFLILETVIAWACYIYARSRNR
jgi:hypothetical protein